MSDEQQPLNPSSNDHIEAHIGDGASDVLVGKDITSVRAGERGVAAGDQIRDSVIITGDNNQVITQRLDPKDAKNQRNHAVMRQMVRKFWIDGVFKSSLYNEVRIRLNLTEQPKAVDNRPWDLILQQPGKPNYEIPPGTLIINIFDEMNGLLLILGAPGSGKTTTLLELADELLQRAEADPSHPTPVVFNLSSWTKNRPSLAEWLIGELYIKYNIPQKIARRWVENDELLPLLDGLDEVAEEHRNRCTEAINEFHREHLVSLVVSSREIEYEMLTEYLKLQGAISLKALSKKQVDEYFESLGTEVMVIKTMLQRDSELRLLVASPLMLSIVTLSYRSATTVDLPFNLPQSAFIYSMRKHLFDAYIKRMLIHRAIAKRYSNRSTLQWLVWLARNMSRHQQSIFQIKNLDPTWMEEERLSTSVFVSSLSLLLWVPLGMIYVHFVQSSAPELIIGLAIGLSLGFGELRHLLKDSPLSDRLASLWPIDWHKIDVRSMLGWIFWLWAVQNFLSVALVALLSGLISTLLNKLMPETIQIDKMSTPDGSKQSPQQTAIRMLAGELVGALTGVLVALLYYLINGGLSVRLTDTLVSGMMFGLLVGVQASGASIIRLCFQRIVNVILRPYLWIYKYGPFNYTRFLDYCHDRIFLRKVGGGYIFVHRMLMEHFASLSDDDIKRIVAEVEASRS